MIKHHDMHGCAGTRLYRIWTGIKQRCYNKNCEAYYYYGRRGVRMDGEWKRHFTSFQKWALSNGYRDDLSIDRIDPYGNYVPENCRCVSAKIQSNNQRPKKPCKYRES